MMTVSLFHASNQTYFMVSLDHGKIYNYLSLPLAIVDTSMGVGVGSGVGDSRDGGHLGVGEPSNLQSQR